MLKITRGHAHAGSRNSFSVYCDGRLLGSLGPDECACFDIPDGDHEIRVRSRWGESAPRRIYGVEHDVSMRCSTDLDGFRAVMTLPYFMVFHKTRIKIEKLVD